MKLIQGLAFVAVVALLTRSAGAQTLLGNTFNGVLYNINVATGNASNPRTIGTGNDSLAGIAFSPGGTLYGLTTFVGTPGNSLITINPTTGAFMTVGQTGLGIAEGDLAFDPTNGTLYGMQHVSEAGRQLFAINVSTGAGTVVGPLGALSDGDFSAMTFAPDGTLYVLDTGSNIPSRLLTVNKSSAATLTSVALTVELGFTAGMVFHPGTGALYVVDGGMGDGTDSLYTLNPTSGVMTLIGPTGLPDGVAGLAFAIPEPTCATSAMLVASMLCWARRRGRRLADDGGRVQIALVPPVEF